MSRLRAAYGASGLHLAANLAAFGVAGYALAQALGGRGARDVVVWIVAGALLLDLVLLPVYSLADRGLRLLLRGRSAGVINHIRIPAAVSGALLLVYFPLILARAPGNIERAAGHRPADYGARWLLLTAASFAVSGVVYVLRRTWGRP